MNSTYKNLKKELALKKYPDDACNIKEHLASKQHQCALIWSDKCAHCEIGFDELKKKLASSTETNEEDLNELKSKIEESKNKLQGNLNKLGLTLIY